MENQFWAVGHWPGLDCVIKGFGPIMSNFFEWFFQFLIGKKKIAHEKKLLRIGPTPFISQSSPGQQPTAQNWFSILWNLGTIYLFSYLWYNSCLWLSFLINLCNWAIEFNWKSDETPEIICFHYVGLRYFPVTGAFLCTTCI